MIKENHRHVAADGMVYMPYLHSWSPHSHNLIDACQNMSSIFGKDPPVFAKPAGYVKPVTAANAASNAAAATRPTPPRYEDVAPNRGSTTPEPSYTEQVSEIFSRFTGTIAGRTPPSEEAQIAKLAKDAEEANAAVAVARAAEANEDREQSIMKETKERLTRRSTDILDSYRKVSVREMSDLVQDQILLEKSRDFVHDKTTGQIAYLTKRKEELEKHHAELDEGISKLSAFIQAAQEEKSSSTEISADELAVPGDMHSAQMLILSSENAINDALYFLDKGLADHRISLDDHLSAVRKLTKKQFLVKAHLLKIGQVKASEQGISRNSWVSG